MFGVWDFFKGVVGFCGCFSQGAFGFMGCSSWGSGLRALESFGVSMFKNFGGVQRFRCRNFW